MIHKKKHKNYLQKFKVMEGQNNKEIQQYGSQVKKN